MRHAQPLVRRLHAGDAEELHALRLEALEAHPEAFLTDASEHRGGGLQRTRRRLEEASASESEACTFGAFDGALDGAELVGMIGVIRDVRLKQRHRACIVSVYVRADQRRRGQARRLMEAALSFAHGLPGVELVYLSTASSNEPALRLYRSFGFVAWGTEPDAGRTVSGPFDEVHLQLRRTPGRAERQQHQHEQPE